MEKPLPAPCLVVLVGPSSSGKSTWAAEHFAPVEIVSSDELRARVGADETDRKAGTVAFHLLEEIVAERLRRKLTTVVDTTGLDADRRAGWVDAATKASVPAYAVAFDTDLATCLERNDSRAHKRPRTVIRSQHQRFVKTVPELDGEGYAAVIRAGAVRLASPVVARAAARPDPAGTPAQHTFGLMLSRFDWDGDPFAETLAGIAVRAENAGFRDIWLMDHFRQIPSVGRHWEDIPDPYVALAHLSAVTSSIRLGCLVTSATHRHPAVLAKMVATLDVVSAGRANCGIGLGWDTEEHTGYGIRFGGTSERYEVLEETVEYLRLMWGKGAPGFHGRHFEAEALACYPRPIQDPVPVLIGGSGEQRTLKLVARLADAANVFGPPDRVGHKVGVLRRHCADVGRDPDEVEVTHLVNALTAPDTRALRDLVDRVRPAGTSFDQFVGRHNGATVEDHLSLFHRYHESGARHSIVSIPGARLEGTIESFADVIEGMA